MRSLYVLAFILGAAAVCSFAFTDSKYLNRAIIGNDGRRDEYLADADLKVFGDSTVVMTNRASLKWHSDDTYSFLFTPTLQDMGICRNEKFSEQPTNGFCSGFLISDTQIVTDSHCFNGVSCQDARFIFGYVVTEPGIAKNRFSRTEIFKCAKFTPSWRDGYAVVELDRPVNNHKPLKIAERYPSAEERLFTIGHPVGLPRKYAANGRHIEGVIEDPSVAWFYFTDLDVFWGQSGAPVISRDTGEVVGILSTRGIGYVYDDNRGCLVTRRCFSVNDSPDCYEGVAIPPLAINTMLKHQCMGDSECGGQGVCQAGVCQCNPGFFGVNCGYWDYNVCHGHGTLIDVATCVCNPGYKGRFCETPDPDAVLLTSSANDNTGFFGYSVSVDGSRIAIGQPYCLDTSADCVGGHVEIFDITDAGITSSAVLSPPDHFDSACGIHVQLRGDVLLLSCASLAVDTNKYSAAVQVAYFEDGMWKYADTIAAPSEQGADPFTSGFGSTFAFQEGVVAVGAPGAENEGVKSGSVFLYAPTESNPNWAATPFKVYLPGTGEDRFGTCVSLDGPHLAVSNNPTSYKPSVSLFFLTSDGVHFVTQLQTKSAMTFGFSFAVNANVLDDQQQPTGVAIVAIGDPGFSKIVPAGGAVHIYDITNPYNVFLSQTLLPEIVAPGVSFGAKVVARGAGLGVFYGGMSEAPIPFGGLNVYTTKQGDAFFQATSKRTDFLPPGSGFGFSIDFNEHVTVVGAPLTEIAGVDNAGAAVAFGW